MPVKKRPGASSREATMGSTTTSSTPAAQQKLPNIQIIEKKPAKQEGANKTPILDRSLSYVVGKLPGPVSGRVQPLYQSYARPAVAKVDGALLSVANRGSKLLGGTAKAAGLSKVKSTEEGLEQMGRRGTMLSRAVDALERSLDKVLPPPQRAAAAAEAAAEDAGSEQEEEQRSSLGRVVGLVGEARNRLRVHAEVRMIVMKVNFKVWYDLNVVPPCQKAKGRALALKAGTQSRVRNVRNKLVDLTERTQTSITKKYSSVRSFIAARAAAVLNGLRAVQKALLDRSQAVFKTLESKARPAAEAVRLRMQPLTDRLTTAAQKVRATERRCVGYVRDKKAEIAEKATTKVAPARKYVAETYGAAVTGVTSRATGTARYLAATADTVLNRALGKDRSAKVQGMLIKYAGAISKSVPAHA